MATKMTMAEIDIENIDDNNETQKIAILKEPYKLEVVKAAIPEPSEEEIRIKIKYVGICGSDLEAYRGTRKPEFLSMPVRLGHEVAGTIDKVGKNVKGLKVGDKVTCRYVWGAYAQYIICKPFNVQRVDPSFDMKDVSLIEILPGVIHAAELSKIDSGTSVLIMGQGVSGLMLTQIISLYSPKEIVVTDIKQRNLDLAMKYGATRTCLLPSEDSNTMDYLGNDYPDGFDVVIPCLLEGEGINDAIGCTRTGGKIVLYGCIGVCREEIDFFRVHRGRIEILSTEPKRDIDMYRYFKEGISLVMDGLINTSEYIDKIYSIDDIQKAFDERNDKSKNSIHIIIDMEK